MKNPPDLRECMSTKDAAIFLAVKEHTLRVWRLRGTGPKFLKLGARKVLYMLKDLEEFKKTFVNYQRSTAENKSKQGEK